MEWLSEATVRQEFEAFVTESTDRLLRAGSLLVWDNAAAEDIVQETLLRVARRWRRVRSMDAPFGYARKILVHLAMAEATRCARRRTELGDAGQQELAARHDATAEQALRTVDDRSVLATVLARLPVKQRAVLVLRYWEDLPEAEVARLLSCSLGAVKSSASRGLARIRDAIGHDLDELTAP